MYHSSFDKSYFEYYTLFYYKNNYIYGDYVYNIFWIYNII
jgi:hypothetical protein